MAELKTTDSSLEMGMHTEQLSGRTQQVFFSSEEGDNYTYPWADQVDFDKSTEIDAESQDQRRDGARIWDDYCPESGSQAFAGCRYLEPFESAI